MHAESPERFGGDAPVHSGLAPAPPDHVRALGVSLYGEVRPDPVAVIDGVAQLDRAWTAEDVAALFAAVRARALSPVDFFRERLRPSLTPESLTPGALCQLAVQVGLENREEYAQRGTTWALLESLADPDVGTEARASQAEVAFAFDAIYDDDLEQSRHFVPDPPFEIDRLSLARWCARVDVLNAPAQRVFDRIEEYTRGRLTADAERDLAFRLGALVGHLPQQDTLRAILIRHHGAAIADHRRPAFAEIALAFDAGTVAGRGALPELPPPEPSASTPRRPRDLTAIRAHFAANGLRYLTEHTVSPDLSPDFERLRAHDAMHWDRDDPRPTDIGLCSRLGRSLESLSEKAARRYVRAQLEAGLTSQVSIRFVSEEVGHGVFADENLPSGVVAGEYLGEARALPSDSPVHATNDYLFGTPQVEAPPELRSLRETLYVDAERMGNETRFMNHDSRDPNLEGVWLCRGGIWSAVLLTRRAVIAGEELRYDYGKAYWRNR